MWKYSYLVHFRSFFGQVVNIQTFSRKCHFYFRFKMAAVFKLPFKWPLTVVLAMAPYPIFLSALKTVIMPIFVLLTESEQFKHISALLVVKLCNSYNLTSSLASEYSHFALLLAARDVSTGGMSVPQQQKFHAGDAKLVGNRIRSSDWSCEAHTVEHQG